MPSRRGIEQIDNGRYCATSQGYKKFLKRELRKLRRREEKSLLDDARKQNRAFIRGYST